MVVPMSAMAVICAPLGIEGMNIPFRIAPTSGFTTMAVARKSTTIKNTTTVSTMLKYLMLPLRTSASAAAEMKMQYSAR